MFIFFRYLIQTKNYLREVTARTVELNTCSLWLLVTLTHQQYCTESIVKDTVLDDKNNNKKLLHWSEKIWKSHSCINNPLKSLEGCEILTKGLAGTSFCRSSYGSGGKMCLSPIINHTIQQQHTTSRPGLSPRQPDSKILSLQMALRQKQCVCVRVCVRGRESASCDCISVLVMEI